MLNSDIVFIMGNCGSGKSCYLAKIATKHIKQGYKVYSNLPIFGTYGFTLEDLNKNRFEDNSVLIFDESASMGLCSRGNEYKKNTNSDIIEFFTTYRHYGIKRIYVCSPNFDDVLTIIRSNVNNIKIIGNGFYQFASDVTINTIIRMINFIFRKHLNEIRISGVKTLKKTIHVDKKGMEKPQILFKPKFISIPFVLNFHYWKFNSYKEFKILNNKEWKKWNIKENSIHYLITSKCKQLNNSLKTLDNKILVLLSGIKKPKK